MRIRSEHFRSLILMILVTLQIACSSNTAVEPIKTADIPSVTQPAARIVGIPVVVEPQNRRAIPKDSRIIITDIQGECATEVRDAVMTRLIDNTDYHVLAREYLNQIKNEARINEEGDFDSTTMTRLGDLLGASMFIVGRVTYCGPANQERSLLDLNQKTMPDTENSLTNGERAFSISAILQVIDLRHGSVLISGNAEGRHLNLSPSQTRMFEKKRPKADQPLTDSKRVPRILAAEDLATEFADKLFARPTWEIAEMWDNPNWPHGSSVRYVQLGRCDAAINLLENIAKRNLEEMPEQEVAEYLHNYGVALLCNNQPERAMEKLRSSFRVGYKDATLRMLNLSAKIVEWSLSVEVDTEPETQMLAKRYLDPELLHEVFPDGPFSISESP